MTAVGQPTVILHGKPETILWIVTVTDSHGLWFRSMTLKQPLSPLDSNDHVIAVAEAAVNTIGACA